MSSDGRAAVGALAESLGETIKDSARSVAERGTTCRVALHYDIASRVRPEPPNDLQADLRRREYEYLVLPCQGKRRTCSATKRQYLPRSRSLAEARRFPVTQSGSSRLAARAAAITTVNARCGCRVICRSFHSTLYVGFDGNSTDDVRRGTFDNTPYLRDELDFLEVAGRA